MVKKVGGVFGRTNDKSESHWAVERIQDWCIVISVQLEKKWQTEKGNICICVWMKN